MLAITLFAGPAAILGSPASADERIACTARVMHGEDGDATVVVRFANGFSRSLHFVHGRFVRADATMSGSGSDTDWHEAGGLHRIRVDDQRYEVPFDLVSGR